LFRFNPHSVVSLAVTLVVVALSWHLFERPINQLKRPFPHREAGTKSRLGPHGAAAVQEHC